MRRLRSVLTALSSALLTTALMVAVPPAAHADVSNADLAYRWAPIHYQDTSSAYYTADYLAPVDYDGDWNTLDNWEDLDADTAGLVGNVYYSVVQTSIGWYITYAFFHPRDWKDYPLDILSHENDMEGLLEVVHKDGSTYGTLDAMVTLAHDNFYSYLPPGSPVHRWRPGHRRRRDHAVVRRRGAPDELPGGPRPRLLRLGRQRLPGRRRHRLVPQPGRRFGAHQRQRPCRQLPVGGHLRHRRAVGPA